MKATFSFFVLLLVSFFVVNTAHAIPRPITDISEIRIGDVCIRAVTLPLSGRPGRPDTVVCYRLPVFAEMICNECEEDTGFIDVDGDGYSATEDCDDIDASINPGADELCDGIDNNCDGTIDEDDVVGVFIWYIDYDGDGYGDSRYSTTACTQPSGYVADATDCDDLDRVIYPGADEYCDEIDSDCDGTIDENDALDAFTWFADVDGDEYGDNFVMEFSCFVLSGYVTFGGDCDDSDDMIDPSMIENNMDKCGDGVDNDCDGDIDENDSNCTDDSDCDGYSVISGDCNDTDRYIYPGAAELVGDGEDQDCDDFDYFCDEDSWPSTEDTGDIIDECDPRIVMYWSECEFEDTGERTASIWFPDTDSDGFGIFRDCAITCGDSKPTGYVSDSTDCDDSSITTNPDAAEVCGDLVDNDCDCEIDEDCG